LPLQSTGGHWMALFTGHSRVLLTRIAATASSLEHFCSYTLSHLIALTMSPSAGSYVRTAIWRFPFGGCKTWPSWMRCVARSSQLVPSQAPNHAMQRTATRCVLTFSHDKHFHFDLCSLPVAVVDLILVRGKVRPVFSCFSSRSVGVCLSS
jgi:hypothetical protein